MIRDRFYCPVCQMEEMQVLVKTPWYNCPDCRTISARADMLTKRTAKLALAGTGRQSPFSLVNAGQANDEVLPGGTISVTTSIRNIGANQTILAFISCVGSTAAPTSVLIQGSDAMTLVTQAGTGGVTRMGVYRFSGTLTVPGALQQVVAAWAVTLPTEATIVVMLLSGADTTPDKAASFENTGTTFTSGAAGNTTTANELLVGSLSSFDASLVQPAPTFPSGPQWGSVHRSRYNSTNKSGIDVWTREIFAITNPRFAGSENGTFGVSVANIVTFKTA